MQQAVAGSQIEIYKNREKRIIAEEPTAQEYSALFEASTLVLFRKRISAEMLMEANEYLLAHKDNDKNNPTPPSAGGISDDTSKEEKNGTYK